MYYIIAFIFAIIISSIEGSTASFVANFFILIVSMLYSLRIPKGYRIEASKYVTIVYILYAGFAYITSLCFAGGQDFYASDPANYIEKFLLSRSYTPDFDALLSFYTQFEGKDTLYIEILRCLCGYANIHLGGATVYSMTLIQTLFGVLSAIVLYKILIEHYRKQALKYALLFSCCSLFLLYSNIILRDIIIAYFYMEAIRILLDKYKAKNILVLLLLSVLAMGIRMLSGVFLLSFLVLYVFIYLKESNNKVLIPIFGLLGIVVLSAFVTSIFFEDSMSLIELRGGNMDERAAETGGLINNILNLPQGVRQVALLLFSQMAPFPPYYTLTRAHSFSQFLIGADVVVFEMFWFVIFYTIVLTILTAKSYSIFNTAEKYLFILSLLFIIALTAHPDIRRMMPVYPLFYYLYLKIKSNNPPRLISKYHKLLVASYLALFIVYVSIKGI